MSMRVKLNGTSNTKKKARKSENSKHLALIFHATWNNGIVTNAVKIHIHTIGFTFSDALLLHRLICFAINIQHFCDTVTYYSDNGGENRRSDFCFVSGCLSRMDVSLWCFRKFVQSKRLYGDFLAHQISVRFCRQQLLPKKSDRTC